MFSIIKSFFEKNIYRNEFFRVVQTAENSWHVKSKNNLVGFLVFSEDVVYVSVHDAKNGVNTYDSLIARYAILKKNDDLSIYDFIITVIKSSIIFYIDQTDISYFLNKEKNTFGLRNKPNKHIVKQSNVIGKVSMIRFEGLLFDENIYSLVELKSKKIINSAFRFSFNCVTTPSKTTQFNIYYIIGNKLFSLNNMTMFKESTLNYVKGENSFNPVGYQYGIQNQLAGKFKELQKKINIKKISILMHRNQYCLLQKDKTTICLSYLADFKYDSSKIPEQEIYTFEQKYSIEIKRKCKSKSINIKSENFTLLMAKQHEMLIFNTINDRITYLQKTHPSTQVLGKLKNLGLSTKTPLLEESFKVIEFFEF